MRTLILPTTIASTQEEQSTQEEMRKEDNEMNVQITREQERSCSRVIS